MPQFNKHTKSAGLKALKPINKIGNTQWATSVRFINVSLIYVKLVLLRKHLMIVKMMRHYDS